MSDWSTNTLALVGGTPVLEISDLFPEILPHRLFAKCEFMNPSGSVKDRTVRSMLHVLGSLDPRPTTLVEATGGNTGLSLALQGGALGYKTLVTMSSKMSREKSALMSAAGAEVIICPANARPGDPDHFIEKARRLGELPGHHYMNQFENIANWRAHFDTTGPELLAGVPRHLDAFVASVGTGGTFYGVGRYLKRESPRTRLVLADPRGSILAAASRGEAEVGTKYLAEGVGGDFVPTFFDSDSIDDALTISDSEAASYLMRLRDGGIFVGSSSGLNVAASVAYLSGQPAHDRALTAATVLCDSGDRYVSSWFDADWRGQKGINNQQLERNTNAR